MPCRGPWLAEIAGAAANRRRVQPDRRAAGKIEIDRPAAPFEIWADCQKTEYAALLAALNAAVSHAVDLAESAPAQRALETARSALVGFGRLPAKAVGDQHKGTSPPIVSGQATPDERLLPT